MLGRRTPQMSLFDAASLPHRVAPESFYGRLGALAEMWATWQAVTATADRYLETLTPEIMATHFERQGKPVPENVGTLLLRNMDHYWFHTGEAHAIRQMLGHPDLPQFVGDMSTAVYRPEKE